MVDDFKTKNRNIELTVRVLDGRTMSDIATEYGLTPERIRQIVIKTCRKYLLPNDGTWLDKSMDDVYDLKTWRVYWALYQEGIFQGLYKKEE